MKFSNHFLKRINGFVLFFFLSIPIFSQVQLLNDAGFENSTANGTFPNSGYWISYTSGGGSGALCTTTANHNGNNGLWEFTGTQTWANWAGPYQELSASIGEEYYASGWIITPLTINGGSWVESSKACLKIVFLNSSKSIIATKESPGITTAESSWSQFSVNSDPAPLGTAYVRFICYVEKPSGISGISVANFDDCFFSKIINLPVPEFSLSSSTYLSPQIIGLSCDTSDVIIYYTIDGSTPTESSFEYTSPITITTSATIKARAYKSGWNPSGIAIGIYDLKNVLSVFSGSPIIGPAPLSVQFEDESLGEIRSRSWYFGDGETSTVEDPLHLYKTAGIYTVSLNVSGTNDNDTKTHKAYIVVAPPIGSSPVDNAYSHIKEQFDHYHVSSYVYNDDISGGNIFVPSIWQGAISDISINQSSYDDPFDRSCTEITFPLSSDTAFSSIKYVYPDQNIGNKPGFDLTGATELSFYAKGSGTVEFMLGGINRKPFHADSLIYMDGIDIRSTGFVKLKNEWEYHVIDLNDDTFWVYLDSTQGLNNKYINPAYMGYSDFFHFYYGSDDGNGNNCMRINWFGVDDDHAGVYLLPPDCNLDSTNGYDLSGITKIRFKAKISEEGNVLFLFGKDDDSAGKQVDTIALGTDWQWYEWIVTPGSDYSNIVGGFGFYFSQGIGTPYNSNIYIDSVYYEGVRLASDFSNVINGFTVSANKNMNPDGVNLFLDEIKYNNKRTEKPRFSQSFVCSSETIDETLKNRADTYDNSLKLLADLALYNKTLDSTYLNDAKLTGDAFIFAIQKDRFFKDKRLRNSYMSGEIANYDSTVRVPGWWDDVDKMWYEDVACVSTSTGNIAWAGLALISLFDITHDEKYKIACEDLADWCIAHTYTNYGFTGGYTGWGENGQDTIRWKSTEHNIDLYALFTRLYQRTSKLEYNAASINAKSFVLSMWNSTDNYFWTGTTDDGQTINTSNSPLDIQAWYIMAFKDSTSNYSEGIDWANINCYLENYTSSNYSEPLNGYDFNTDLDGIWFEGTSQAVLANKMKGNSGFVEPVLNSIRNIQTNHLNGKYYNFNDRGIVAADHDLVSTGFEWNYNNRLHIGATSWYVFAELGINPYFINSNLVSNQLPVLDTIIQSGISACFDALQNITVAGEGHPVTIQDGASADFIAGNSICFLPGFYAQAGSFVHGLITTDSTFCDGVSGSIVEQPVEKSLKEESLTEKQAIVPGEKSVKVYPNPNNGQFTLELINVENTATVCIYNLLGSKVYQSKDTNQSSHKIILPGIKRGIYFVKVTDQKEQFTKKMIVN
jgi:PKD repeat protein